MPNQPVIVTGAAGFIGSHLAAAMIDAGREVIGIDNFDPFYSRDAKEHNIIRIRRLQNAKGLFKLVEIDIREREALASLFTRHEAECVFHIAALAGVRPSIKEPARFADVNVNGTVSVLDATRAARCPKFIFASSSSVYGNNRKVPFAEDDPVSEPISPYAATKRASELICHTYAHLYGLRVACLRFFTVYGPGQRPDLAIATFMRRMRAGVAVPMFGDGTSSRDYTYIDDVIGGVVAAERVLDGALDGHYRIWNLGGSSPVRLRAMIDAIARIVGVEPKIDRQPMPPGDVLRTFADLTRSARELGYRPRTPFEQGLCKQWEEMECELSPAPADACRSADPAA